MKKKKKKKKTMKEEREKEVIWNLVYSVAVVSASVEISFSVINYRIKRFVGGGGGGGGRRAEDEEMLGTFFTSVTFE